MTRLGWDVTVVTPSGYQPEKAPINYKTNASDRQRYQSIIGSLLFVMLGTRPDIAFFVIKMSQYMANPMKEHIQKVLHIVKYLGSTPLLALSCTEGDSTLNCYCDSDWAGDLESQCSTSDYSIFILLLFLQPKPSICPCATVHNRFSGSNPYSANVT